MAPEAECRAQAEAVRWEPAGEGRCWQGRVGPGTRGFECQVASLTKEDCAMGERQQEADDGRGTQRGLDTSRPPFCFTQATSKQRCSDEYE